MSGPMLPPGARRLQRRLAAAQPSLRPPEPRGAALQTHWGSLRGRAGPSSAPGTLQGRLCLRPSGGLAGAGQGGAYRGAGGVTQTETTSATPRLPRVAVLPASRILPRARRGGRVDARFARREPEAGRGCARAHPALRAGRPVPAPCPSPPRGSRGGLVGTAAGQRESRVPGLTSRQPPKSRSQGWASVAAQPCPGWLTPLAHPLPGVTALTPGPSAFACAGPTCPPRAPPGKSPHCLVQHRPPPSIRGVPA